MEEELQSSYIIDDYLDSQAEIDRLKNQARIGFQMELPILQNFGIKDNMKILDAGCGPGFISQQLASFAMNGKVLGFDNSKTLIEIAKREAEKEQIPNVGFQITDIYNPQLQENEIDFAYSRFVFQHLRKPIEALTKIKDYLKTGGKFTITDIDDAWLCVYPQPKGYNLIFKTGLEFQKSEGGDRLIGRKLYNYFLEAGYINPQVYILTLTTNQIGMEMFLNLAVSFKLDHLKKMHPELNIKKVEKSLNTLIDNPKAFGALGVFFVCAEKP